MGKLYLPGGAVYEAGTPESAPLRGGAVSKTAPASHAPVKQATGGDSSRSELIGKAREYRHQAAKSDDMEIRRHYERLASGLEAQADPSAALAADVAKAKEYRDEAARVSDPELKAYYVAKAAELEGAE